MDKVLKDGHFMLIYPEQSMWWNYRKPKPLKKAHLPLLQETMYQCFLALLQWRIAIF